MAGPRTSADSTDLRAAPPPRLGLLGRLNLLSIGLIVITAFAITGYLLWQEINDGDGRLKGQARTFLAVLSEVAGPVVQTANRDQLARLLDSLADDRDIAYVVVLDAKGLPLAARSFGESRVPRAPLSARLPDVGEVASINVRSGGQHYLELIGPIAAPSSRATSPNGRSNGAAPPAGYLRVGMSYERQLARLRDWLVATISVAGLLVMAAIVITVLLTRRIVAPVRELTQAVGAIASGNLDVRVPQTGEGELGELTVTFNRMTERLARSQAQIGEYQRTLEEKVTQRTRELEVATARAYKLAQHDILTGLPNRSLLNERLRQILAQAQRDGHDVACLFLDFDHFKRINDTLGHDAGDQMLQTVAQRLTAAVRESDTVARLGGDEFVVVLPGLDPAHAEPVVMAILGRIRETFGTPIAVRDQELALTCSIGVSVYPHDAVDPDGLIKQADTAMYAAKEQGRNTYRFFTADMNARIQARLRLESNMRRGLTDDEFFLVFQPQIEMSTGWPIGVEALLRWRDPGRGLVPPSEFIPVAEDSGLIHPLGAWALTHACRQVHEWHRHDMPLRLSVNVSVSQLQHESWLKIVERALSDSGLAPRYLDLEITESMIISNPEKAVATLMQLKQMGVTTTIDDFGTGYSSLSYLARLPIHCVKIDQRFVRGLEQRRSDEAITLAIIALSHSLGLRVIAEGVETPSQFAFLKAHACEEAQGFFIAKPMTDVELSCWWNDYAEVTHHALAVTDLLPRPTTR